MLEEGICDHRHERMTVKALPGSSLEVIETEFFFQLLVSLLANPSRLDGGRHGAQVRLRRQVGEIVFLLSGHPVFADEPGLLPGQMLLALVPDLPWWPVCYAHTDGGKTSLELSLRGTQIAARASMKSFRAKDGRRRRLRPLWRARLSSGSAARHARRDHGSRGAASSQATGKEAKPSCMGHASDGQPQRTDRQGPP